MIKLINSHIAFIITAIIFYSCNSNKKENRLENTSKDSIHSEIPSSINEKNEVKFSIDDTIKKSEVYFFSNSNSKDLFLLTISPGTIENSKSELKIVTEDNKVIYKEIFRTYYFIKGIEEPEVVPTGSQKKYEEYMERYKKSLTINQYKTYFNKNLNNFFADAIYPIEKNKYDEIKDWEDEINDKEFLREVLADSTVNIIDMTCFDCDEGGKMIGYSKKNDAVKTLLEHD